MRFDIFALKTRKQRLSSSFCFAPQEPCFGRSCEGSWTVFPSDTRSSSRKLHIDLYAGTDWRGWIPARRKKAVWGSREKKATANELPLIGRSSIRETLHSSLTRCCVLKGRTIITNWTCGRGGVCRCRGRKKHALKCLCICVPLLVCPSTKGELVPGEMLPAACVHCGEVRMNSAPMLLIFVLAICA